MPIAPDLLASAGVTSFFVALSLLARGAQPAKQSHATTDHVTNGHELLSQCIEWFRIAKGTKTPLFAYRHTCFSLAYLNAARLLCDDNELRSKGVDVHALQTKLESRCIALSRAISRSNTKANPNDEIATTVSWV